MASFNLIAGQREEKPNPTNNKKYKYFFMQGADIRKPTPMELTVIATPEGSLITPISC